MPALAEDATYGVEEFAHARAADVLKWYYEQTLPAMERGFTLSDFAPRGSLLSIPCHEFAASVILKFFDSIIRDFKTADLISVHFNENGKTLSFKFHGKNSYSDSVYEAFNCPVNPFMHMQQSADGLARVYCTAEELFAWGKELS